MKISREEFITLLRQLVEIESPYFHEDDVMAFVNKWLNERGVPAEIHTFYEGKETMFNGKNVVGIMDSGKPGPVIYLGGHLDTVSLCNGWTKPPFEGVVEGDYMYGVGTLDMKAGCAAIMLTLEKFAKEYFEPGKAKGKLVYHLVSDEEGPYGLGTVFIINDKIHNIAEYVHTVRTKRGDFMRKKELTEAEKKDLQMKMEIAEELGLLEKVEKMGWKGLTARESGKIGGIMGQRKIEERKKAIYNEEKISD